MSKTSFFRTSVVAFAFGLTGTAVSQAVTVVSQATEDYWLFNETNRAELIVNNTGSNPGRWSAVRFDSTILSAQAFTDASQYTLLSATLTLVEQSGRNGNNAALSGRVGAGFYDTATNSAWSGPTGNVWSGNTAGRPGRVGGSGATPGANNIDERSNGAADLLAGLTSPGTAGDGTSWQNHTFDAGNSNETVTIDLTEGGATLLDIQSILADWTAGNNAGMVIAGEFGNQAFFAANSVASGATVGSTIDGDSSNSGTSLEAGNGQGGQSMFLTLEFEPIPEPSTGLLAALAGLGLIARRRR